MSKTSTKLYVALQVYCGEQPEPNVLGVFKTQDEANACLEKAREELNEELDMYFFDVQTTELPN